MPSLNCSSAPPFSALASIAFTAALVMTSGRAWGGLAAGGGEAGFGRAPGGGGKTGGEASCAPICAASKINITAAMSRGRKARRFDSKHLCLINSELISRMLGSGLHHWRAENPQCLSFLRTGCLKRFFVATQISVLY